MEIHSTASIIEHVPEASTIVECIDFPTTSKDILSQVCCFLPKKTDASKDKYQCVAAHEVVSHDHHYADTPCSMKKKLETLRRKLDTTMKENKNVREDQVVPDAVVRNYRVT